MTTTTKTKIKLQKILATPVNDFEFMKSANKGRENMWQWEYLAKVSVKIRNAIEDITVRWRKDYDEKEYKVEISTSDRNLEYKLERLGLKVDWSSIEHAYRKLLPEKITHNDKILTEAYGKAYDLSYIHQLIKVAKVYKQYGLTAKINQTKEEYIHNRKQGTLHTGWIRATVTYKGYETSVDYEDTSRRSYKENFQFVWSWEYKKRRTKHSDKMLLKFMELVDLDIEAKEREERKTKEKDSEVKRTVKKLSEAFGYQVIAVKEDKSYRTGRRGQFHCYQVDRYYIPIAGKHIPVVSHQADPKHTPVLYSIGSLTGLTIDKARAILKVLGE